MSTVAIPHDVEPHPLTGMYNGKFGIWLFLASEVMLFGALFSTYVLQRVGAPDGTWPARGDEILNVWMAFGNTLVLIASSVTMVMSWAHLKLHNVNKARLYLLLTFTLAGAFLVVKYFEYSAKFSHHQVVLSSPMDVEGVSRTRISGHLVAETDEYIELHPDARQPTMFPDVPHHGEHADHAAAGHDHALRIERKDIQRMSDFGPSHSNFLAVYFTLTGLHGLHIVGGMIVILYMFVSAPKMWRTQPEKFTNRVECTGLYWHFVDLVWIFLFPVLYLL